MSLSRADLPYLLPRVGIAVVFVGIGLWELFDPGYWAVYVPSLLAGNAWTLRLVQVHGLVLTTTATAVVLPRYARWGAVVASLLLVEVCVDILVANGVTSVLLRDVGLLVVAAGLVRLPYARRHGPVGDQPPER
ncbi:MAG: hypothetical protein ABEI96_05435 [Haloarculaceae archaeon]